MQELDRADEPSWSSPEVREKEVVTVIRQKLSNRRRVDLMVKEMSRV
jgi:hypothetical protein